MPAIGAIGVTWLVKTFAPEAKGHGVPEVMYATHYNEGKIRPAVVVVKSLASALSIGSGGSIGREGPIIQIGAAIGSLLGQWVAMPASHRIVLVAAGGGAGIAATFNAPLGGILFAVELLLVSVHVWSVCLVTVATIVATFIGRLLMGATPAFDIPALQVPHFVAEPGLALAMFVPFGILIGLATAVFIRAIYKAEDLFDAMPGNDYTRHVSGMLCVGVMIWMIQLKAGYYYVQGVGYAAITDILAGMLSDPGFLLVLFALKFLATCLTLGSGASGGVFSPSLFMGACLGAAYGHLMHMVMPDHAIGIVAYALAGMTAMIGAGTAAVFTAIVMVFEMTGDGNSVLPILLCTVVAFGTRKLVCPPSIYTLKLERRGHVIPENLVRQ
ncbi:MAG: chloride channel protein [Alphaproteobacteria bacterium]